MISLSLARRPLRQGLSLAAARLALAVLCTAPTNGAAQLVPAQGRYEGIARDLEVYITAQLREHRIPALSIALIDDQQIAWARGFGTAQIKDSVPATAETVHRVGSVSKLFTDIGIMQLAERGEVDLDAPVTRYLPEFAPGAQGTSITLRRLMSHRSGLMREPPVGNYFDSSEPTLAATVNSLNGRQLVYPPETKEKYSNAAIGVVGYVLERTQRQPFVSYLQQAVLEPMGLRNSAFQPLPPLQAKLADAVMWTVDGRVFPAPTFQLGMSPAGSMYSTVMDLGTFVSTLFNGGVARNGNRILRRESLEAMWRPQSGAATGAGLGFFVGDFRGNRIVRHGGAIYGFSTDLAALPDRKLGVVVIATKDVVNSVVERIANRALAAMLGAAPDTTTTDPFAGFANARTFRPTDLTSIPSAPRDHWRGLIGEYGWDYDTLYLLEKDGKLHALIEWFFLYPLEEIARDTFRFPQYGLYDHENLVFRRDAAGRATQVEAAGVVFPRRLLELEDGKTFKIQPQRPAEDLRREALAAAPPVERGEFLPSDLVELQSLDPTIRYDIRYATTNNFMGAVFYTQQRAFLQRPAAEAVVRAHRKLRERGYGILIHDAYRPWYVTKMFWDATPESQRIFVANPANGSRHNRGAAVDLTLYELATGRPVEMVGGYDEFSERSYPDYPGGTSRQRWLRQLLRETMEAESFRVYDFEWWHFDYADWRRYPIGNLTFEQLVK